MYCLKLSNIKQNKLSKIKWLIDEGIVNSNVWLAGGSLRTLIDPLDKVCDYDLFFKRGYRIEQGKPPVENEFYVEWDDDWTRKNRVQETRDKLINLGFKLTFECPEGKLFSYLKKESINQFVQEYKVQLICEQFYQNPVELLHTFDLTPCLFATDGTYLWTEKRAIRDVKIKHAHLYNLTYPVATIKRIIKYAQKGYWVNAVIKEVVSNLNDNQRILDSEALRVYID